MCSSKTLFTTYIVSQWGYSLLTPGLEENLLHVYDTPVFKKDNVIISKNEVFTQIMFRFLKTVHVLVFE